MNPQYPVFIPTKGRYDSALTIKAFQKIGVPFSAVVVPAEAEAYAKIVDPRTILVLPSDVQGLVPTRNWIWDYAQHTLKTLYFWTFDDNIRCFYRLHQNVKHYLTSGTFLRVIEDFMDRYENLAIAGMQYEMFAPRKKKHPPLIFNTRVYSNMLIRTDIPYRNRGVYNDDTDLCLRLLKDKWCVVQFVAFLADKAPTMRLQGGNTAIYQGDGRYKMALELQQRHPDVVKIVQKWGRWQHEVDYRPFRNNALKLKPGVVIPPGVNNYGMLLTKDGETIE